MSTLPRNSKVIRRYLVRALKSDTERPRPPITLAGPRANGSAPSPPLPGTPPTSGAANAVSGTPYNGRPNIAEPEPGDEQGPYSHTELTRMDNEFRARLQRAFKRGKESREAATALYDGRVRRPALSDR
jgi:hypothetical protein